jgi:predicted peptidase
MRDSAGKALFCRLAIAAAAALTFVQPSAAQAPSSEPPANGPPRFPMRMEPDPRVQQRTYHFADTDEDLAYTVFVSSKVKPSTPAPLIVARHGYGGDSNFIVRGRLIDLAEENGYIVVVPMGYNATGWYGSPVIVIGGGPVAPPNLTELSEKDVMNVLAMARREFNVDPKRTYLMGHSMGGAGTLFLGQKYADQWAAIAAIAPAAFLMQPNQKEILAPIKAANLPLMITQGDQDPVVPVASVRTWAAAMDELDLTHEYVEMPGRDHGNLIADGMPDIFRFFAAHTRGI